MFIVISKMTSFPLHLNCEVSVCQIGAVAVLMPFPKLALLDFPLVLPQPWDALPKNDSPDKHLRQTIGAGLDEGANGHDSGAQENCLLSAKPLTNGKGNDGTEKATNIVDSSDGGEDLGLSRADQIVKFEKVLCDDNTACIQGQFFIQARRGYVTH